MQIIRVWLKITAILAVLGWAVHMFSPGFAAWWNGLFARGGEPVIVDQMIADDPLVPPSNAGAIRADDTPPKSKRVPRGPYEFNE